MVDMGDLFIYTWTVTEGPKTLRETLCALRGANLALRLRKCIFFKQQTVHLGFVISLRMSILMLLGYRAFRNCPPPQICTTYVDVWYYLVTSDVSCHDSPKLRDR